MRIIIIIATLVLLYLLWRGFRSAPPQQISKWLKRTAFIAIIGILLLLALTGRLHWLFVIVGAALPLLQRLWQAWRLIRWARKNRQSIGPAAATTLAKQQAYDVLGLQPGATREEIIKAHRSLMHKAHPDKGGSDEQASRLNTAKEILLKDLES